MTFLKVYYFSGYYHNYLLVSRFNMVFYSTSPQIRKIVESLVLIGSLSSALFFLSANIYHMQSIYVSFACRKNELQGPKGKRNYTLYIAEACRGLGFGGRITPDLTAPGITPPDITAPPYFENKSERQRRKFSRYCTR